ncbi:MAG: choice-of-anchor J domain-containing protein, partial [Bacteroidetes bacterium]|nr:choice-of-anchor J domain-containing protein [Bacteroidota bacterium]
MKKIYLTLLGVFTFALWQIGNAQTILFSEDFASGIPGTWTLINNDGLTPNSNVAQFTNAWIGAADFDNTTDTVAMSTSWYTPAGTADDWLITPAINLTTNNTLSWEAEAQDVDYPDGYEVRISTTTPTIAGFNANPPLFSIGAESGGTWTQRSVDLQAAGYSNQTVYIAWRNNSNDMFVLMVDDIAVTTPANSDLAISDVTTSGELQNTVFSSDDFIIVDYSKRTNFTADVTIENTGTDPVSVIYLTYALVDNLSGPTVGVIYGDTVNLGTPLAPGQTYTYSYAPENITSLFPSLATDGTIDFYVQLDSAANNTVFNNDDYYYGAVIAPTLSYTAPYSTSYEIADLVAGQFDFSHTTWGWKYFDNDNDNNSLSVGAFSNIDAYDGDFLVIGSVVGGSLTTGALNETMQSPELTLTAGQSYEFSIWARTGYGATGSVAAYLVDASGTTNTLLGNITLAAGDSTYQQFTFPTTPTTTKSDYMVEFRKSATGFVILDLFNMTTSVSP